MSAALNELRQSIPALARRPGYAAVVILTVTLGIGGATAAYSAIRHVMLDPLPFPHADRLVHLWETHRSVQERPFSIPNFESVRERARSLDAFGAYIFGDFSSVTLTGGDRPERIAGAYVIPGTFGMLGVEPARGRAFSAGETVPGEGDVVILGHELWTGRFGADPDILGRVLPLSGREYVVVGVMPPGFEFPVGSGTRLWRPLPYFESWAGNRGNHVLRVIGRLAEGADLEESRGELADLGETLAAEFPDDNAGGGIRVVALHEQLVGDLRPAAYTLAGAVVLLWLIAAANLANLGVARVLDRLPELIVRRAHGATRLQVARVLVLETALLVTVGTALGILAARAGLAAVVATGPSTIPRLTSASVDAGALLFAVALAALTAVGSGLLPVLASLRGSDAGSLATGHRGATHDRRSRALRNGLVVVELALALVLVVASTLMLQSLDNLLRTDPGIRTDRILTAEVALPGARYPNGAARQDFYARLLPRLERIPGVEMASAVNVFPLTGNPGGSTPLFREGASGAEGSASGVPLRVAMPNYFETVGLPLLSGRTFDPAADEGREVAVVNRTLATLLWGNEDPIGLRLFGGTPENPGSTYEVIGLVDDVRDASLDREPRPHIFLPYPQFAMQEMVLVLRTTGPPETAAREVRNAVLSVDPDQPIEAVASVDEIVSTSVARPRFLLLQLGLFAAVALMLSGIGVYGVMAHAVAARTRELGIRMALGADSARLLRLALGEGLRKAALGIGLGTLLTALGVDLLESLLFGVAPHDLGTFAAGALLLAALALAASLVPAWRASRVSPTEALRAE